MVKDLLCILGIPIKYLGHRYLDYAVELAMADESILSAATIRLYPAIAQQFGTTAAAVNRNMRTAIDHCWERGNRALLDQIAGYPLRYRPSVSEFLSLLVAYLRRGGEVQDPLHGGSAPVDA